MFFACFSWFQDQERIQRERKGVEQGQGERQRSKDRGKARRDNASRVRYSRNSTEALPEQHSKEMRRVSDQTRDDYSRSTLY